MPERWREDYPQWYKDAIIYEVHIRSFYDSNGDGIGDFRGLLQKIPYLRDLGITAIWILPFYPSPLRDDGYDIADYLKINPDYGTMNDFREFLREAHAQGIRVITELVLNHTSDQHAWFQRARRAKSGSTWRNFYVWSDDPNKYQEARIIFKDFELSNWSWDPVAKAYYWHRFYSHQPDLNFDNPQVHKAVLRILDFWLGMGVDGLRLDAIPYLYEREGTNCENLPETYAFIKELRAHIDGKYPNRLLLAEANQWPEDAVAYFGKDDMCQMAFHFPLMPRMFMAIQMEDRFPIVDILEQTPKIPDNCQWGLFLRNHDELTLEMVTDEERDYMYSVYARDPHARINLGIRRRLAPLMGNNRRKIELLYLLLFTLPGTPILYYGDEIGMGDNYYLGDRNGVRTPMQWSPDRNAGFSTANPQKVYLPVVIDPEYYFAAINVENQEANSSSLLWWMRRMIAVRRRYKAFGRGSFELHLPDNPKVLSFVRKYENEVILVLANLSRFSQIVEIKHPPFTGYAPIDIFSRNRFPVIKDTPYTVVLGAYDTHLLLMKKETGKTEMPERVAPTAFRVAGRWEDILKGREKEYLLQTILPRYLERCRWFDGKARKLVSIGIESSLHLPAGKTDFVLLFMELTYTEGNAGLFLLPLHYAVEDEARCIRDESPQAVIAVLESAQGEGVLYDGIYSNLLREKLFATIVRGRRVRLQSGTLAGVPGHSMRQLLAGVRDVPDSVILKSDEKNTSIIFDNSFFFRLYRQVGSGIIPEAEAGRFFTDKIKFEGVPPLAGTLEYRRAGKEPVTLGILQGYIPSQSDAWTFTRDEVERYFERVLETKARVGDAPIMDEMLMKVSFEAASTGVQELFGSFYQKMARLLGQRTGELHLSLSSDAAEPDFALEPFSKLYQRSVYQSMRTAARRVFSLAGSSLPRLTAEIRKMAVKLLTVEQKVLQSYQRFINKRYVAGRIRIHDNYHLGQVLFTGKDFIITDFEGDPARSISECKIKRSPLRDIAGMIRSFHYAAYTPLYHNNGRIRSEDTAYLEPWAEVWYRIAASCFLNSYLAAVAGSGLVPDDQSDLETMLNIFILDKAIYELGDELKNRPEMAVIPIKGIMALLADV